MQLSSKASPVVLKPFTNVHSPFWLSSFQHLTHTLPKSLGTNTAVTTTSNLVPLLTACYLVTVHHCSESISPSPPCSHAEQQLGHAPFCSGSAAALLRRSWLPASSFLLGTVSGQLLLLLPGLAALGQAAWGRQLGNPKLEGCRSTGRCPSTALQRSF